MQQLELEALGLLVRDRWHRKGGGAYDLPKALGGGFGKRVRRDVSCHQRGEQPSAAVLPWNGLDLVCKDLAEAGQALAGLPSLFRGP